MMTTSPTTLRYQWPEKSIKTDCPACGPKHRKTLSRYVDTRTGETLPDMYGRCDREINCGYHLSPYDKSPSGMSYADEVYERWKQDNPLKPRSKSSYSQSASRQTKPHFMSSPAVTQKPVYSIPNQVFQQSLGHYERNAFARLLQTHFGMSVAGELLDRFQIGTSAYYPGACVFWLKDEQNRVRGGQVVLFNEKGHTAQRTLPDGSKKRCTNWVHYALASRYDQRGEVRPDWLTDYIDKAEKFPVPFGLPQLIDAPVDQPVAIVEAPKTAVICTPYFPDYVWIAVGALSYLNESRLAALRNRSLMLFPDLSRNSSAYNRWSQTADNLRKRGFKVDISSLLEDNATEEQRDGDDLADYLLDQWKGYPPNWDADTPHNLPNLTESPSREEFAQHLSLLVDALPLYQLSRVDNP